MNRSILRTILLLIVALMLNFIISNNLYAKSKPAAPEKPFRIGMIGLDTSHVIKFTKYINDPNNNTGCKVVASCPR